MNIKFKKHYLGDFTMESRITNRMVLKQKFANRELTFGGWISYREPGIAETLALAGFDFIAIDMEHTTISIYMYFSPPPPSPGQILGDLGWINSF